MNSIGKYLLLLLTYFFVEGNGFCYTVTGLTAKYHDGQVFLTWTCPNATNLKYNVYRSSTKFTSVTQLNSDTYIGNVRDSSSKNIRLSQLLGGNRFFKVDAAGTTLTSSQGLYVFTCTDNQKWFYAVMVEKLSNNVEAKKINAGKNTLNKAITEHVADPLPIRQDSLTWNSGDQVEYFAWFVNNKDAPNFPAMCSQGSYGFNFYLIKRGNAPIYPLFAFYEGLLENSLKGNGTDSFKDVTDCYILGFDDWLPVPNGSSPGENTFWSGYHENYDFYSDNNPVPTSGVVKLYSQKRYIQSIIWAKKELPVDTARVYVVGVSAGAMGAYLTANIIPDQVTAAYCVVGDFKVITIDNEDTQPEQMWGDTIINLNSDILDPETQQPIPLFNLFDTPHMLHINRNQSMPLFFCVYGKNDFTIPWTPLTISFIDSLRQNRIGGMYFWDQRNHKGNGQDFTDDETMPDWYSYSTNITYPAFSSCTIDQNPGNGIPADGAPYGVINGYLAYDKENITDETCKLTFHLSVTDLFVGGTLDPIQYNSCFADVTVRRAQNFHPAAGQKIKWNNFDNANVKIQSGSFTYQGGLITVPGVQINKSGCRLEMKIANCLHEDEVTDQLVSPQMKIAPTGNGYVVSLYLLTENNLAVTVCNLLGQTIYRNSWVGESGENQLYIPLNEEEVFILNVHGDDFSKSMKIYNAQSGD